MKEIKAYIRLIKAEEVINALQEAQVPGFTVIEVKAMGLAAEPEKRRFSINYDTEYSMITKLEVVCKDEDVDRLCKIIKENAYTGHQGDGMIFVSDVGKCIKIRTGERGEEALIPRLDK